MDGVGAVSCVEFGRWFARRRRRVGTVDLRGGAAACRWRGLARSPVAIWLRDAVASRLLESRIAEEGQQLGDGPRRRGRRSQFGRGLARPRPACRAVWMAEEEQLVNGGAGAVAGGNLTDGFRARP